MKMSDTEDFSDEEVDINEKDHQKLISSIASIDKRQRIKKPTRTESVKEISEFGTIKKKDKVDIYDLVKLFEGTAGHASLGKKLKRAKKTVKPLSKPLEKVEAERIQRSLNLQETKTDLDRWDAVVATQRSLDHVSFPLRPIVKKITPTDAYLSKFKLKSDLEKELDKLNPAEDKQDEDENLYYPMTLDEITEHRKHASKMRAQQSYIAAKAKRQSKIKSKKYHRIQKRQKLKDQLKEFEILQKTNPEEALKKLEDLERARVEERHTLRHKNTGKWAKSKLIRAKYDKDTRQELAEQLAVSRDLTRKVNKNDASDSDAETVEYSTDLICTNDVSNPWVNKQQESSKEVADFVTGYRKYWLEKNECNAKKQESMEDKHSKNHKLNNEILNGVVDSKDNTLESGTISNEKQKSQESDKKKIVDKSKKKIQSTSQWQVEAISQSVKAGESTTEEPTILLKLFDNVQDNLKSKVAHKIATLQQEYDKLDKEYKSEPEMSDESDEDEQSRLLLHGKKRPTTDIELIETASGKKPKVANNTINVDTHTLSTGEDKKDNTTDIDPKKFFKAKPKYLITALPSTENGIDDIDDEEENEVRKINIEEGFEDDDIVASFREEKDSERKKGQPSDIDLTLPGWGSWGGKNIKLPRYKKRRFITKAPKQFPRRDDNKGDIIIREFEDAKIKNHKVSELPYPFTSVKDFEATIRAPIGNTFIPETAHQRLIKPSVSTKIGTVIEPMDEDELLKTKVKNGKFKFPDARGDIKVKI